MHAARPARESLTDQFPGIRSSDLVEVDLLARVVGPRDESLRTLRWRLAKRQLPLTLGPALLAGVLVAMLCWVVASS